MSGRGHDLPPPPNPPKFLEIKKDDKFFTRLLSKETSSSKKGESSFRVLYYGGAKGSIPFTWESQPGTPKHPFSDNYYVPPLTPPPSYQFSTPRSMKTMQNHHSKKPNFFHSIFARISSSSSSSFLKKSANSKSASLSTSSSSSYSSSYSLPSTPMNKYASRRNSNNDNGSLHKSISAIHFGLYEDDDPDHQISSGTSPTSTLCFGGGIKGAGKFGSSYPLKKAFLSIVGHGPA
ncbi:hypothetical protein ACH5RR_016873 [Cinchona calisaya]|uniref:Uncharacterized protein n=1 Tax=Cinchona calisaya TaxID=153742 RepID=A0ABD2ZX76_9GENT